MMKRRYYLRYLALLGIGALGLAILVPSDDGGTAASPQSLRSSLATSQKLSTYLEGQLRSAATRNVGTEESGLGDMPAASRAPVESITVAAPVTADSTVDEFSSRSPTALNVRAGPGRDTARLFVLQPETPVRIDHTRGKWAKIVTADGKTGWVYASYFPGAGTDGIGPTLAMDPSVASAAAAPVASASTVERKQQIVTHGDAPKAALEESDNRKGRKAKAFRLANDTVLRSSPSKGSNRLSVVQGGSRLLVTEWDGAWARVILSDGTSGWINAR